MSEQIEIYKGESLEVTITVEGKRYSDLSGCTPTLKIASGFTQAFLILTGSTWNEVGNGTGGVDCQTTFYEPYFNYPERTYTYQFDVSKPNYKRTILQSELKVNKAIP